MPDRRRLALSLLGLASAMTLGVAALAQDAPEPPHPESDLRLRLDLDPTGPAHDLLRARFLLHNGRATEGVALLERIARDPRAREGLVQTSHEAATATAPLKITERILASFDRQVRDELLALKPDARDAFEALHQAEAQRLLDRAQATDDLGSLRELIALYPAAVEAGQAALLLGERELEQGDGDSAAFHLELAALDLRAGLAPADVARARALLPAALALAGRGGEGELALEQVSAADRPGATAGFELAKREAASGEGPGPGALLGGLEWAHDTLDYYEDAKLPSVPLSEPVLDATRLYVHDASHALALSLATGSVEWQTVLTPGEDAYRRPSGPCRLALGTSVVACALPQNALVVLDRSSGAVLFRLAAVDLERVAGLEDHDFTVGTSLAVSGDTLVVPITSHHSDDELVLVGLDARSGTFRWRTGILSETADPEAAEPVLAPGPDAVFLCSGRGVVASLESLTGSVQWLRRYASFRDARVVDPRMGMRGRRFWPGMPGPPVEEGAEKVRPPSPPQFVGLLHGLVVAAPADCKRVFAFAPRTGEDVWTQGEDPPGPDKKPAPWTVLGPCRTGVLVLLEDGTIKLLERHERVVHKIPGAKLAGRPAVSDDALFLPLEGGLDRVALSTGDVALLDDWGKTGGLKAHVAVSGQRLVAVTPARTLVWSEAGALPPVTYATAPELVHALGDPRFATREAAQAKLLELGVAARDELSAASGSRDPERRLRARFVLDEQARRERLEAWRPRVLPEWLEKDKDLLVKLTHRNPEVRLETLRALAQFGDGVVPLLKDLLADTDARVGSNAAMALLERKDRSGIELIFRALASEKVEDRIAAAQCLQRRGSSEDLPAVVAAAKDVDPRVRAAAVVAALALGKESAIPLAIAALDDKDASVRAILADELLSREIPPPPHDKEALDVLAPVFRKLVHDPQRAIRERVITEGLTERPLKRAPVAGAPPVAGAGPQPPPQKEAGWVPRSHPAVFEALGEVLNDPDPTVRDLANYVLINARKEDLHLMPRVSVERALAQPGRDDLGRMHILQIAESLLDRGEPFAAEPLARTALETKSTKVRARSLEALEKSMELAPFTPADVAAIASLVAPANEFPMRSAGYALLANGKGEGRGRLLLQGLDDPSENLRSWTANALAITADRDVLHELLRREVLAQKPEDQASASQVLDARAESPELLAPMLIVALSDPEANVRATAWRRLRAVARREADLGLFEPGGTPQERAPSLERAARWWWQHTGHDRAPEVLLEGVTRSETSAQRWKAAKKLADLGAPELRPLASEALLDGLGRALSEQTDEYVQKQIVVSLGAILGKDLGWKDAPSGEEKARILKAAKDWRSLK